MAIDSCGKRRLDAANVTVFVNKNTDFDVTEACEVIAERVGGRIADEVR